MKKYSDLALLSSGCSWHKAGGDELNPGRANLSPNPEIVAVGRHRAGTRGFSADELSCSILGGGGQGGRVQRLQQQDKDRLVSS